MTDPNLPELEESLAVIFHVAAHDAKLGDALARFARIVTIELAQLRADLDAMRRVLDSRTGHLL